VRSYSEETVRAAVREYEAGVKAPVVCRRYGISERTLYRWRRAHARARAESGQAPQKGGDAARSLLCEQGLRIVGGILRGADRDRAVRALESRLEVSRAEARRMLGLDQLGAEAGAERVGIPVTHRRLDARLSKDFGKSRWLAVYEPSGRIEFLRNVGMSGVSAAMALRDAGCRDVIVPHVGPRAQAALEEAGLRLWRGRAGEPAQELVMSLAREALAPWPSGLVTLSRRSAAGPPVPS
jgi:predicted Fe-Mo cluster-binding NifX family protein